MKFPDLRFLRRLLPQGDYVRNVGTLLGGNVAAQIVALITYPILTRIYTPHEYGLLSVFVTMVTVPATIASLKYEMAIPLPKEDHSAASILFVSLVWLVVVTLLTALGVLFLGEYLMAVWDTRGLLPYLWCVPVSVFGTGLYQALTYWAMRAKDFKLLAGTLVSKTITETGTQLGCGWLHLGTLGLVLGTLTGSVAGNWSLGVAAWRQAGKYIRKANWQTLMSVSKEHSRFPIFTGTASLINIVAGRVAIPFLAAMFGGDVVGWFSLANMALEAPSGVIRNAVMRVYYPEAAVLSRKDPVALRHLYLKNTRRLCLMSAPPLIAAVVLGPMATEFFFGKSWGQTGIYIQYLVPAFFLRTIAVPLSNFSILDKQEMGLAWNVAWLVMITGSLWLARVIGLSSTATIAVHSLSMCAGYILMFAMSFYAITSKRDSFVEGD